MWRWIGGGTFLLILCIGVVFAFLEKKTTRVAVDGTNVTITSCVGISPASERVALADVVFEHHAYRKGNAARLTHEFRMWLTDKSRELGRFAADAAGTNLAALRKIAPQAVANYEKTVKK
jgi:hypothetical protein